MQVDIDDTTLAGFNAQAKLALKDATSRFASDLIHESFRIEALQNAGGGPQITSAIIAHAAVALQRGFSQPRKKLSTKIFQVLAAALSLAVGILYDSTRLQDKTYLFCFIMVIVITVVLITLSIITE